MSSHKVAFLKIKRAVKFFTLVAFLLTGVVAHSQTNSLKSASISPDKDKHPKGFFVYEINPGESVEDTVLIKNQGNSELNISLTRHETKIADDGSLVLNDLDGFDSGASLWLNIKEEEKALDPNQTLPVEFSVTVPPNTPAGEYTAAISVAPTKKNAGVSINVRDAVVVYVLVRDAGLNIDLELSNLEIINGSTLDLASQLRKNFSIRQTALTLRYKTKNLGNVFAKVKFNLTIERPNGQLERFDFENKLAPKGDKDRYYQTNIPLEEGLLKATLKYKTEVYNGYENINLGDNTDGELYFEIENTRENNNKFKLYERLLREDNTEEFLRLRNPPAGTLGNKIPTKNIEIWVYVLAGVSILVITSILIIAGIIKRKGLHWKDIF